MPRIQSPTTPRWRRAALLIVLLGSIAPEALAAPAERTVSVDDLYTALIAPSLADDGRISSKEREAILTAARSILDAQQLQELEAKMAPYLAEPLTQTAWAAPESTAAVPPAALDPARTLVDCPQTEVLCEPAQHACHEPEGLFDNLSLFGGLDGSKQPQDLGVNANMGGRFEGNWAFPLLRELGIGAQIGTSYNFSATAVHVLDQVGSVHDREQYFTTLGLFQRTCWGLSWGFSYDFLSEQYYDHFNLAQWRGLVSYDLNECNQAGVWFAVRDHGDTGSTIGNSVTLQPLDQVNVFVQHTWLNMADTRFWIGAAEGHNRDVFGLFHEAKTGDVLTYGAEVYVPLNNYVALYGLANFLTPANTGTVDAYLGFAIYPGGGARQARKNRFAPLLPVADNPTFAVDWKH